MGAATSSVYGFFVDNGVVDESCLAYTSGSGRVPACQTSCDSSSTEFVAHKCSSATTFMDLSSSDRNAIKSAILEGSLHISFKVPNNFRNFGWAEDTVYKRGATEGIGGGHAVRLIGWGVDSEGDDYWILMNSWGSNWGYSKNGFHGLFNLEANRSYVGYSCGYCTPDTSSVPHPFAEFLQ